MVIAVAILSSLLVIGTIFQSTYPDDPRVRSKKFKGSLIAVAAVSAILLFVSSIQNERAQNELRDAVAGVSQTIFPRDMKLHMAVTYSSAGRAVGIVNQPFVLLTIVPPESAEFCRIGVTSTPVEDSVFGELFPTLDPAPSTSSPLIGFGDPTVQVHKFQFKADNTGDMVSLSQEAAALPLVASRRWSMDELVRSQFIVEVIVPGTVRKIDQLNLLVKGKPIPFEVVRVGNRLLGSTVFRPTYEARCLRQRKGGQHDPVSPSRGR